MRKLNGMLLAALAAALVSGCARHTEPVVAPEPGDARSQNFERLWDASLDVLGDYYFEIDRRDRREGVITTRATVGRQFFEAWRKDAATAYDLAEGSLQTIYRMARVSLVPVEGQPDRYQPDVTVETFRADQTPELVYNIVSPVEMFLISGQTRETRLMLSGREIDDLPVTYLGDDESLADKIAADILDRAR